MLQNISTRYLSKKMPLAFGAGNKTPLIFPFMDITWETPNDIRKNPHD